MLTNITRVTLGLTAAALLAACGGQPAAPAAPSEPTVVVAQPVATAVATPAEPAEAPTTAPAPAGEIIPDEALQTFVAAVNAGDVDAARATFAPDVCVAYGNGACKGPEELTSWLQSDIFGVNGQMNVERATQEGNAITLEGRYTSTGWSGAMRYVFTIENGQITSWRLL